MAIHVTDLPPWAQAQVARKMLEEERRRKAKDKPARKPLAEPEAPPQDSVSFPLRYIIRGEPRTKKNHQEIAGSGRRSPTCGKFERQWVQQGGAHRAYRKLALPQLVPVPQRPIDQTVHIQCRFYMASRRRVDGLNLEAAVDDLLVDAGILADDNSQIVVSHDGSRVLYDKVNPRTEITILLAEGRRSPSAGETKGKESSK